MVKRRIPVSNKQVNETKLINSLNSKLLKKEDESVKALKKRFPGMEKTVDSFVNVLEETLAEAENKPAVDIPQDVLDGLNTEAVGAYECGTEIAEDSAPNFDKVESDRQREIKYNAHADKIGYADAGPTVSIPTPIECLKDLTPESLEKLEKVIGPVTKSILERFDHNKNTLKDNEECRKAVNSEVVPSYFDIPSNLTDYGKKVLEAGKKAGRIVVGKDTTYEMVNHPTHYNQYDIEVIDMIIRIWGPEAAALWCDITAFKYRMRMGTKPDNSIEQDIKKEQWYLNKSKEIRENLINKN